MPEKLTLSNRQAFETFILHGEVVEVRILGAYGKHTAWDGGFAKGVVSGYFDEHEAFIKAIRATNKTDHQGIYFTLQKIDNRLLGRAFNRLKPSIQSTSDNDVRAYRWLLIDIDPCRPSGISSSDTELQNAKDTAIQVIAWLSEKGFPEPIQAMSGNGVHLLYRLLDTPVIESTIRFIQDFLKLLAKRFNSVKVNIDTSVFNPARICRLYGTSAKKGDSIPAGPHREARPHRGSYIVSLPEPLEAVSEEALQTMFKLFKKVQPRQAPRRTSTPSKDSKLDVSKYLDHYQIEHRVKQKNGSTFFCLDHCIFDAAHSNNEASIIQGSDGKLLYQCFHNSCQGRHWKEARNIISGTTKLSSFLNG